MEKFPYLDQNQDQSKLVINQFIEYKNSVLESLIKDSSNSVDEHDAFPIYVVTTANSLSEDLTELDNLQSYLSKNLRVGIINTEKWTLYLLPTLKKEFCDILDVEKPGNVNDLFFIIQFPKNERSTPTSTLLSRPNRKFSGKLDPAKSHKNYVITTRRTRQSSSGSTQTYKEISNDLDAQSSPKKRKNSARQSNKMQNNFNIRREISDNLELQSPPAKKYRSLSTKKHISFKKNLEDETPSPSRPVQTLVEDEFSEFSINFRSELKDFFKTSTFTVIGSKYIESQKVIAFLKEIGGIEVVAKDPRIKCVIFHQNEGFVCENFLTYKHNETRFFLISRENTTLTLQEIFVSGGVILVTATAIKNTLNIIENVLSNLVHGWDFKIHPNILSYIDRLQSFLSDNESMRVTYVYLLNITHNN
ncbi:hypothetical protein C1645_357756 [Glomus cerebriforme]|uniref:Uncharacterized protein n=1 Tax=Glomus cerebriforme TaxID=658196 RepID=A0A397TMM5_9GLOM|nr:hypothetical protein C1645_357756 [Glomus cerebriforme]